MEVNLHRTRSLLGEKVIRLRHLEQSLQRANIQNDQKHEDATLSDISSHSASSGISSTEFATGDNIGKSLLSSEKFQESSEIIQSLENLNSEIREIWDVLRTQQQQTNIAQGNKTSRIFFFYLNIVLILSNYYILLTVYRYSQLILLICSYPTFSLSRLRLANFSWIS